MAGLDTPGPAEYGNTSETLFSLGSTIGGIGGTSSDSPISNKEEQDKSEGDDL